MLRGLCTVNFFADDHVAAAKWYSELFGVPPYYDSADYGKGPGYLEFRIGDYEHEFGILSSKFAPHQTGGPPAGAVVYWHVDDIEAALDRVLALGAKEHAPITEQGDGFITASVVDPFGNVLGLMYNQHYLDILAGSRR